MQFFKDIHHNLKNSLLAWLASPGWFFSTKINPKLEDQFIAWLAMYDCGRLEDVARQIDKFGSFRYGEFLLWTHSQLSSKRYRKILEDLNPILSDKPWKKHRNKK